jgi:L-alanine-DL-glutamate epimerase-like enolase superfamily enzyme
MIRFEDSSLLEAAAMRITGVEAWLVAMRLARPYTASYDTVEATTNVFLRVLTDRRLVGYGCAAPDEHATGETTDAMLEKIHTIVAPLLKGADPLRPALLLEQLRQPLADEPSIRAAVDMALLDILGKKCDAPLWKLLGGYRDRMMTSVTVGILSERETVIQAREWVGRGFRILKLKGGIHAESDAARVLKVREAVGEGIALRFDANEGYSVEEALWFIDKTASARLELLEQPTRKNLLDLLGQVTRQGSVPVMADESLGTLRDAFRLARNDLVDMLNVSLMKVGGVAEARQINAVAKSARLEVMVGCLDESALGIAAGLHFALSDRNVGYADLDGHLDLAGDPAAGAVTIEDGTLFPSDQPGLGFELRG